MTTGTNPAFTDKDKAALEACSEFDKMFRATALQDQQSIVESLPHSFDHHWAWNSEIGDVEYAPRLAKYAGKAKPVRKETCCLNCGANPKKREWKILHKVKL